MGECSTFRGAPQQKQTQIDLTVETLENTSFSNSVRCDPGSNGNDWKVLRPVRADESVFSDAGRESDSEDVHPLNQSLKTIRRRANSGWNKTENTERTDLGIEMNLSDEHFQWTF
jgi:Cu/Ag efflux pump CusA